MKQGATTIFFKTTAMHQNVCARILTLRGSFLYMWPYIFIHLQRHIVIFQLLLRVERDQLINDMVRERAKEEVKYCFNQFAEMSKCQQEEGIVAGLWRCRPQNDVSFRNFSYHKSKDFYSLFVQEFKLCMQWAFYSDTLRDQCKEEYVQRKRDAVQKIREAELEDEIRLKVIGDWIRNQDKK